MTDGILRFGEYPAETVFQAQDLYCVDRLSYEAVAARTDVSVPTLKRWGDKYGWRRKREELLQAESQIKIDTTRARAKMLALVVEGGRAQDAFAVASLEALAMEQAKFRADQAKAEAPAPVPLESPAQVAELLEAALSRKLGIMLADFTGLDLKAVRDMREALNILGEMRGRAAEEAEGKSAGLTRETEARIKELLAEGL